MKKTLFMMVGPAGSGKSTWIAKEMAEADETSSLVSRDEIRFSLLTDTDSYFDKEEQVFEIFIHRIQELINNTFTENIYVDATHLTEKARNRVFDALCLDEVDIVLIVVAPNLETALRQNEMREGLAKVPRSVIRRMYYQFQKPTYNEKYKYTNILEVCEDE